MTLPLNLHLELVVERVGTLPQVGDEAMQLQPLALPRVRILHHLVDVDVVLGAFGERRIHQPAERRREHEAGQSDPESFCLS